MKIQFNHQISKQSGTYAMISHMAIIGIPLHPESLNSGTTMSFQYSPFKQSGEPLTDYYYHDFKLTLIRYRYG